MEHTSTPVQKMAPEERSVRFNTALDDVYIRLNSVIFSTSSTHSGEMFEGLHNGAMYIMGYGGDDLDSGVPGVDDYTDGGVFLGPYEDLEAVYSGEEFGTYIFENTPEYEKYYRLQHQLLQRALFRLLENLESPYGAEI